MMTAFSMTGALYGYALNLWIRYGDGFTGLLTVQSSVTETRRKARQIFTFGIWDKVTVTVTVSQTVSLRSPDRSRHPQTGRLQCFSQRTFVF